MTDKLEEIELAWNDSTNSWVDTDDMQWLIDEVKRLRVEYKTSQGECDVLFEAGKLLREQVKEYRSVYDGSEVKKLLAQLDRDLVFVSGCGLCPPVTECPEVPEDEYMTNCEKCKKDYVLEGKAI